MDDLLLPSEAQMCRIEPYFPHGIARVDDRRVLSGILFAPTPSSVEIATPLRMGQVWKST